MIERVGHNPGEERGDQIKGSRMFRDWCYACGEAIRMTSRGACDGNNQCTECRGAGTEAQRTAEMWQYLTPRQQHGKRNTG